MAIASIGVPIFTVAGIDPKVVNLIISDPKILELSTDQRAQVTAKTLARIPILSLIRQFRIHRFTDLITRSMYIRANSYAQRTARRTRFPSWRRAAGADVLPDTICGAGQSERLPQQAYSCTLGRVRIYTLQIQAAAR